MCEKLPVREVENPADNCEKPDTATKINLMKASDREGFYLISLCFVLLAFSLMLCFNALGLTLEYTAAMSKSF